MEILSNIDNELVLHIIHRRQDFNEQRFNLVDPDNFLQVASLRLPAGKTFNPHKHIWQENFFNDRIAQESWVVIQGNVEVVYYDLDGTEIHKDILSAGDCSITLEGGHNYKAMDEALVYEFKSGPYEGVDNDKELLNTPK